MTIKFHRFGSQCSWCGKTVKDFKEHVATVHEKRAGTWLFFEPAVLQVFAPGVAVDVDLDGDLDLVGSEVVLNTTAQ